MTESVLLKVVPEDGQLDRIGYLPQFCITDKIFGCSVKVYQTPDESASVADFFAECLLPGILIDEGPIKTLLPGRKGWQHVLSRRQIGDQTQNSYPSGQHTNLNVMLAWYHIVHDHFTKVRTGLAADRHNVTHKGDFSVYDNGRIRMIWN